MKNLFLLAVGLLSSLTLSAQPEGWNDPATTLTKTTTVLADGSTVYYLKNEGVGGWFIQGNNWWTQACVTAADAQMPETSPYGFQVRFSDTKTHEGYYQMECMSPDGKYVKNSWKYVFDNGGTIYTDYNNQGIDKTYWKFTFDGESNATLVTFVKPSDKVGLVSADGETPTFSEDDGATSRGGGSATGAYTVNNTGTVVCTTWSLWCMGDPNAVAEYTAATNLVNRMQEIYEESSEEFDVTPYAEQIGNQLGTLENAQRLESVLAEMNTAYYNWQWAHASGDNPVEVALVNPSFEVSGMNGWSAIEGTKLYASQGNKAFDNVQGNVYAEFWHQNNKYSAQQTVENLPAGVYKLSAYAYSSNDAAVLFMNDTESDTIGVSKKYFVNMYLAEPGSITLGIKSSDTGGAWNCVDDFKLLYLGNDGSSWAALFNETYENKASLVYQQGLQEKIAAVKAAQTQEEIQRAYQVARDYEATDVAENVAAWVNYNQLVKDATILANDPNYVSVATELSAMIGQKWELKNEATDPTTKELFEDQVSGYNVMKAEYEKVRSNTPAGTDVTEAFIKNYDFTQALVGINSGDATKGWRIDGNSSGGNFRISTGDKCGECWNGKDFDFYQIIENVPEGVYQVVAQGFTRAGRGNTSWGFYHDQQTGALLDNPVFGDWTPNEAHIYLNDNTGNLSISYAYPHAVADNFFDGLTDYYQDPLGMYQYPDNMPSSGRAFAAGEYKVEAFGLVSKKEGEEKTQMRIGMKGNNYGLDNWAIFTNFRLIYQAFDAGIIEPEFVKAVESLGAAHVGTELQSEMKDLLARAAAVSHSDGKAMFNILSEIYAFNVKKEASEKVFANLQTETQNLEAVYAEYKNKCSEKAARNAQALQARAQNAYEDEETGLPTVTTEEASEIIAEIPAAIKALKTPASAGSDDNPVDFTDLIDNANMASAKGWIVDGDMGIEASVAEFFGQEKYSAYQQVSGLPEGLYAVQVQGYYRAGEIAQDWPAVAAGTESNAMLFVTNDNKTLAEEGEEPVTYDCPLRHISAEAIAENPGFGGEAEFMPFAEQGDSAKWYMPNNRACAAQFFAAEGENGNFYTNLIYVYVWGPDDTITLGVKKEGPAITNDWCAFSNWKFTGYGNESVKEPGVQTFSCSPVTPEADSLVVARYALGSLIEEAIAYQATMTDSIAKAGLGVAIADAQVVYDNVEATCAELVEAKQNLSDALEAVKPAGIEGDVNGDGQVDGTDIQAVINVIVANEYDEKADVNNDGAVDGTDIQTIINIIVGSN